MKQLVFKTKDNLQLFKTVKGNYTVATRQDLLSIVGAIMIDQHDPSPTIRNMATGLLKSVYSKPVYIESEKKHLKLINHVH